MQPEQGWAGAQRLLCTRLDSLEGLLLTTPALRALKEAHPRRSITLLTTPSAARAAPLLDMVDETLVHDGPGGSIDMDESLLLRLRAGGFDGAVIFNNFQQDPLPAARLISRAGIPRRLGQAPEDLHRLLTDWIQESDQAGRPTLRHEVRRQLDLVRALGDYPANDFLSLNLAPESVGLAVGLLYELGLDMNRPWLVLHPGASESARRYPAPHFAQAAEELASAHGFQILFTGSGPETELVEEIRGRMHSRTFSLSGQLDLQTLSAVIFLAPLLISNNNAPVHLAAALQTPVVDLYALTHPQQTPWKVPHRTLFFDVPCKFCYSRDCPLGHQDCLRRVAPGRVVQAVLELIKESSSMEELKRLSAQFML